jgi:pyruvate dehydrogenase E2 component (dihydrolipoamide acetyltransferase)
MNQPITMPALSDTMNNGRLLKWVKKIGDPIKKGESVADIETDKAVMDVEAFHDGYLAGPLAAEGSEMPVGAIIGYIADSLGATAQAAPEPKPTLEIINPPVQGVAEAPLSASSAPPGPAALSSPAPAQPVVERARISPYARRLAQQMHADVRQVNSGEGETKASVGTAKQPMRHLSAGEFPYRLERASSVREALARAVTTSLATPTFRMTARLTLAPLLAASKAMPMSLTLLLVRACALTVREHPWFSAMYTPEGFAFREKIHVAIAVDTPDGLVAPVIHDVAGRPLRELATDWNALHEKAVSRRLEPQDYQGATFYLSNLGMFSVVHSFDAVLLPGAAAVLCVASEDGGRTSFTLTCDHRVLSGADAARFMQTLAEYIANPSRLIEMAKPGP